MMTDLGDGAESAASARSLSTSASVRPAVPRPPILRKSRRESPSQNLVRSERCSLNISTSAVGYSTLSRHGKCSLIWKPSVKCSLTTRRRTPMAWPAFKQIRFQQLRAFGEAASTGSFARAAVALGVSRPAVWQQIRALEREFGAAFLLRKGNRLELTREGRLLAELVAPLVSGFGSLRTRFEERRGEKLRRLAVATTSGLLAGLLQAPIREFRRRHPEVQLTFLDRASAEAVKLVTEGATDLGVVGHLEEDPVHPLLKYETLAS